MSNDNTSKKRSKDSIANVLIVAISLCLVCSVLVSTAAVVLRPIQERNKAIDRKKNILKAAGLLEEGKAVDELFKQIETKMVELATGEYVEHIDLQKYKLKQALKDPELSAPLAAKEDIAKLRRQEKYSVVYLVKDQEQIKNIILPIRGAGLYSTLYGFLALDRNGSTISGMSFYEQGETPGLGGEIENPRWLAKWQGKQIYDATGAAKIEVIKGVVDKSRPEAVHQVDSIAGATLTSRGVGNLVRFWFSEAGYQPLLSRISTPSG
ncbi:MAG: Na(+)-translocating NADH-quinone reductase subunit C [Gammaproteobacteria bacterium]|nr:Na(+)-translocating NADH-quinone reductase subunit C [Gammaproteobacteria bacterium]